MFISTNLYVFLISLKIVTCILSNGTPHAMSSYQWSIFDAIWFNFIMKLWPSLLDIPDATLSENNFQAPPILSVIYHSFSFAFSFRRQLRSMIRYSRASVRIYVWILVRPFGSFVILRKLNFFDTSLFSLSFLKLTFC